MASMLNEQSVMTSEVRHTMGEAVVSEMGSVVFEIVCAVLIVLAAVYSRFQTQKKMKEKRAALKLVDKEEKKNNLFNKGVETKDIVNPPSRMTAVQHAEPQVDRKLMSEMSQVLRDNNVHAAMKMLDKAREEGANALDLHQGGLLICASSGDVATARHLMKLMSEHEGATVFAYNTLIKVYAFNSNITGAKNVLTEMADAGVSPNRVSYNIIANLAASSGDLSEVSDIIERMLYARVDVDRFTIGILFKALKKEGTLREVEMVFQLMDRFSIDACSDSVLLPTFLEVCIKYGTHERMEKVLRGAGVQMLYLKPHAYNMLIQAWEKLDDMDRCISLWNEMVNKQQMSPSRQTVGAIVRALLRNVSADTALEFLEKWKDNIGWEYNLFWQQCMESKATQDGHKVAEDEPIVEDKKPLQPAPWRPYRASAQRNFGQASEQLQVTGSCPW